MPTTAGGQRTGIRTAGGVSDPAIDEHFKRSLGPKKYAAVFNATNTDKETGLSGKYILKIYPREKKGVGKQIEYSESSLESTMDDDIFNGPDQARTRIRFIGSLFMKCDIYINSLLVDDSYKIM